MFQRFFCIFLLTTALLAVPLSAQDCDLSATIGNFEVDFQGAFYDGFATEFTYCVTGLATPALSNWMLSLDPACIGEGDLVGCSPEPCFFQSDDPNLGITGIKFDDVEVEPGEEECFSYSLEGDWTALVGDTTAGLKAGQNTDFGSICGPVCVGCGASMQVLQTPDDPQLILSVSVIHNRPPTVETTVKYQIRDREGNVVHGWKDGPIVLELGNRYRVLGPIPNLVDGLPPGDYALTMRMEGMSQWIERKVRFTID